MESTRAGGLSHTGLEPQQQTEKIWKFPARAGWAQGPWGAPPLTALLPRPPDLQWKIIYVGSAESEEFDQVLDSVLVGPVPAGRHMFVFQVSAGA